MIDPKKALDNLVQSHVVFRFNRAKPEDPWENAPGKNKANKDTRNEKNTPGSPPVNPSQPGQT